MRAYLQIATEKAPGSAGGFRQQRLHNVPRRSRGLPRYSRTASSMSKYFPQWRRALLTVTFLLVSLAAHSTSAQRSSLYQRNSEGVVPLATSSLTYVLPPREIRLNDLINVRVSEKSAMLSEGEFDGKKNASIDAQLKSWIELDGLNLKPAPQPNGDPRANGIYNTQFRAEGELESRDLLTFNIQAMVVDIRPNGNLVIEARKQIKVNEELQIMSLSGIVRREDIAPNNVVLSERIAELMVTKNEAGHVRDAYKRGWLHRVYDRFAPF
jgi:flagellar L-ring protein FlgH